MTASRHNAAQHIGTAEKLGSQLHMALTQLMADARGADGLPVNTEQVVTVNVNPMLSTPGAHLGNARSAAAAEPKVAADTNGANVDNARQQRQKPYMVECRHGGRKGNGHHRIDPGLSQGMQAVGRRHQFLGGQRTHHDVRIRIEGDHDRFAAVIMCIANNRFDQLLVPTMHAIKHANSNRRGTQELARIKSIGRNDTGLIQLTGEKDTRELVGRQHHRTPPIA